MKARIRRHRKWRKLNVSGSPKPFKVDYRYYRKLNKVTWNYEAKTGRARANFKEEGTRKFLHRYIVELEKKYYPEVCFINDDRFDCRAYNLKPYRADEEGASRTLFRTNKSGYKGVSFCKKAGKWQAIIRVRTKNHFLGYFATPDKAAKAYAKAFSLLRKSTKEKTFTERNSG